MAEPNYLAEVNRARQQARGGRRQRMSDVINSLDSAESMDRLQGVNVSDFSTGVADAPQMNLAGMITSGGAGTASGGSPFRTAAGSNANASTISQSQCPGGRCNIPRATVVQGGTPAPRPTPTIDFDPTDPAALSKKALELALGATVLNDPSQRGVQLTTAQMIGLIAASQREQQLRQDALDHDKTQSELALNEAKRVYEANLPGIQAANNAAAERTIQGSSQQRSKAVAEVARGNLSVTDYVQAMTEATLRAGGEAGEGNNTDLPTLQQQFRTQGYSALAAYHFVLSAQIQGAAKTGGDFDDNSPRQMMQRGVALIADSYATEGYFDNDWGKVGPRLKSDILPVLKEGLTRLDLDSARGRLSGLEGDALKSEQDAIALRASINAQTMLEGVTDELYQRWLQYRNGSYNTGLGYKGNFTEENMNNPGQGKMFPGNPVPRYYAPSTPDYRDAVGQE